MTSEQSGNLGGIDLAIEKRTCIRLTAVIEPADPASLVLGITRTGQ